MQKKNYTVCVFCGSKSGNNIKYLKLANTLGKKLAERNFNVIYGGGNSGLMGALAEGVLAKNGSLISVIPKFFKNKMDIHNENVNEFFKKNKYSRIVIYGAAAKTTVFINYFRLDHNDIEYVVDDTPIKQNKYIPNTKIKIFSSDYIKNTKPNFIIISAWNYGYDIYSKIKYTKKWGCKILVFFPSLKYF